MRPSAAELPLVACRRSRGERHLPSAVVPTPSLWTEGTRSEQPQGTTDESSLEASLFLSSLLQSGEASESVVPSAGDFCGLPCCRWPLGCRAVGKTMDLRLADGCSPSFFRLSRFQCPVRADEATAAARMRNKSFLALPRLDVTPLRCHRRACGGGALGVQPLFWSSSTVARICGASLCLPLFCFEESGHAGGHAEDGWPDRARASIGGDSRRWRVQFRDLGSLGRGPGRWTTAEGFIYCDSSQSQCAMGFLQIYGGSGVFVDGSVRQRRSPAKKASIGVGDFSVILLSFRGSFAVWSVQLSLYPCRTYLYLYVSMYLFLIQ